jgi:methionine sulfoxide reductase heme-binding subunit
MSTILSSVGPSAYWYLTRSTGAVALLLLSGAVVLGVLDVRRINSPRWPRFVIDSLHRNVSLLAMSFLGAHILTSVLDGFAPISLLDAFIPFTGSYRPFWLGLGAVALDMLVAVTITSVMRQRMGYRRWRAIHWLAYASWPVALLHGLGTGSDVKSEWLLALGVACLVAVIAAVIVRASAAWYEHRDRSRVALCGAAIFALFLALWVPSGPLGPEWARRSGTPANLLPHGGTSSGSKR